MRLISVTFLHTNVVFLVLTPKANMFSTQSKLNPKSSTNIYSKKGTFSEQMHTQSAIRIQVNI